MEKLYVVYSIVKNYFNIIWSNVWLKITFLYVLYLFFVILLWFTTRRFIKRLINKTKTNLDDKIVKYTKRYFYILILLFGINFSFKFIAYKSAFLQIIFQGIKTLESILVLIILTKSFSIIKRHLVYKWRKEPEKLNLLNLFYIAAIIIIYSIGGLYILKIWGINITPLLASAGIFGLAVAMAAQDVLKNFLAGIIIFFDKPIKVGDKIRLSDGKVVFVEEIGFRSTKFRTLDGNILIIPNSDIINQPIENYNEETSEQKRVKIIVGLPYGVDVDKAKEIVKSIFLEDDRILKDTVTVWIDSLADWSVNIGCSAKVPAEKYDWLIEKELLEKIYKTLPNSGIDFPFPTYEVILSKNINNVNEKN